MLPHAEESQSLLEHFVFCAIKLFEASSTIIPQKQQQCQGTSGAQHWGEYDTPAEFINIDDVITVAADVRSLLLLVLRAIGLCNSDLWAMSERSSASSRPLLSFWMPEAQSPPQPRRFTLELMLQYNKDD